MKKVYARFSIIAKLSAALMVLAALVCSVGAIASGMETAVKGEGASASVKSVVKDVQITSGPKAKAAFEVKSISLKIGGSNIGAFLRVGEEKRLVVAVKGKGKKTEKWEFIRNLRVNLSDQSVAQVYYDSDRPKKSQGFYVKTLKEGNTRIYIDADGKEASILLCVKNISGSGLTVNMSEMTLKRGQAAKLMATANKSKPQTVKWSSDDNTVATVSMKGVVTALKEGTATITARNKKKSAQCVVTVTGGDAPTPSPTPPSIPYLHDYTYKRQGDGIVITAFNPHSAARDLIIPSEIEGIVVITIGNGAFQTCRGLTSVTIPSGVTSIGESAFYGCSGLTSVTVSPSVTSIGIMAFYHCASLTSITIPASVTSIGDLAFSGCSNLTVRCPSDSYAAQYCRDNNIPYTTI